MMNTARRGFSTVSPKAQIAQLLLKLEQVGATKTVAELEAVKATPLPKVELTNLPTSLAAYKDYFALGTLSASTPYVNPGLGTWEFAVKNLKRDSVWPFLAGIATVVGLFGAFNASLPADAADSNYIAVRDRYRSKPSHDEHH